MDYQTYSVLSSTIIDEESLNLTSTKFYSRYSFSFYFIIIVYEYVLSIYVILNANHPILKKGIQLAKQTLKVVGGATAAAVGYRYAFVLLF
jgi:hypothetical protein